MARLYNHKMMDVRVTLNHILALLELRAENYDLRRSYIDIAADVADYVDDSVVSVLKHLSAPGYLGQQSLVGCLRLRARLQTNLRSNSQDLTRLPFKQHLKWLRAWKPLAYRESTCLNLSESCPYGIIIYSVLEHLNTTSMYTISW